MAEIGSPMAVSRHLILHSINASGVDVEIDLTSDDEIVDEGKTPSFCVLLHGALKVENMSALVSIGKDFSFMYLHLLS